jgi:hypothetical protein
VGFSRLITEITHWVTLSNFIPIGGNPNDLDLAWHDMLSCQSSTRRQFVPVAYRIHCMKLRQGEFFIR